MKKINQVMKRIYKVFVGLLLCIAFISSLPIKTLATTSGPRNAGIGVNVSGVGTVAWSNPGEITTVGSPFARTSNIGKNSISNFLSGTNFGFAIPSTATIDGISVTINRYASNGGPSPYIQDNIISLVKAGFIAGNNKASSADWPVNMTTTTYGSSVDTWGTTWTSADVNSADFGVALSVINKSSSSQTPYVDYMQITVSYTMPITNIGDGTSPANKTVKASATNIAASSFTLNTTVGADTVSSLVVSGTGTANITANGARLYLDSGSIANEWDSSDTQIATASFSGGTATFTGLSLPVTMTSTRYIITYDFIASPNNGNTLTAFVSGITSGNTVTNNDNIDATLTVDTTAPTVTITQATGQSDPTYDLPINFSVVFSEAVYNFALGDVTVVGTAGATTDTVTGSGTTYNVAVSGMTKTGTVIVSIAAGIAHDAAGNANQASGSSDNTVTLNGYTVIYDGNGNTGGSAPVDANIPYIKGTTVTVLGDGTLVNTGYTFDIWNTSANNSGINRAAGSTFNITSNTTLYTIWKIAFYEVLFDSQGGSAVGNITATYDMTIGEPTHPERTGYIFGGWYRETDCINAWNFPSDTVTGSLTLYAKWTIETNVVLFDSQGGSAVGSITANYCSTINAPASPAKKGYTFLGWYKEAGCVNAWDFISDTVTDILTLYAKWTINSYTVTFEDGDATVLKTQTVEYNTDATPPTNPNRAGYTFTGWLGIYSHVAGDTTVTAIYDTILYTVLLDSQGGSAVGSITAIYDATISEPAVPEKTGYLFNGWYREADYINAWNFPRDTVTGNLTLYAKWAIETNVVLFDSQGGSLLGSITTNYGSTISAPADPSRKGYTFGGWYKETGCVNAWNFASDKVAGSLSLFAKWTSLYFVDHPGTYTAPNGAGKTNVTNSTVRTEVNHYAYTVSYNINGGNGGATANSTHIYDVPRNLSTNEYTKRGYTFAGWATSADGAVVYSEGQSVINLTSENGRTVMLYAKWTPLPATDLPRIHTIHAGDKIVWNPMPYGGTWDWDEEFFTATFDSPATFKALKVGTTTIQYSVDGIFKSIVVSVISSTPPPLRLDITRIIVLACLSGAELILVLRLGRHKPKPKT